MYKKVLHGFGIGILSLSVIFTWFVGIKGVVVFNTNGFYPDFADIFRASAEITEGKWNDANRTFDYMAQSFAWLTAPFAVNLIIAILFNFTDYPKRAILSVISAVGAAVLGAIAVQHLSDTWYDKENMNTALLIGLGVGALVLLVILVVSLLKSDGLAYPLLSLAALLFHILVFPIVMLLLAVKWGWIVLVIAAATALYLFVLRPYIIEPIRSRTNRTPKKSKTGAPVVFSGSAPPKQKQSISPFSIYNDPDKIRKEIASLERKNEEDAKGLAEYYKGTPGFGHIRPEKVRSDMESRNERIRYLKKELAKIEAQKK